MPAAVQPYMQPKRQAFAFASALLRLASMTCRGLDFIDRERAKHHAQQQVTQVCTP